MLSSAIAAVAATHIVTAARHHSSHLFSLFNISYTQLLKLSAPAVYSRLTVAVPSYSMQAPDILLIENLFVPALSTKRNLVPNL